MDYMRDSAMPRSLTGLLMSNPWMMLAVEVGEIGLTLGTGMRTGAEALGEWYSSMGISVSGEQNRRGSGKLVHEEGM